MSEAGMTAAEVAARLGVKRETVYAYVSRGLLHRTVATDGRTSLFDRADVERFRLGTRTNTDGELHTLITTRLTRVDDDGLWVAGRDVVELVDQGTGFIDVVELLWGGADDDVWPTAATPDHGRLDRLEVLDRLRVIAASVSSNDPLRHDLSPSSVRAAGRRLITEMTYGIADSSCPEGTPLEVVLWGQLTDMPSSTAQLKALDAALALLVDHGLASSTFAARIAASARSDPYAVVGAGLGVLGGSLHGAASRSVHELLSQVEEHGNAAGAIGEVQLRSGSTPGFGHSVYTKHDPRFGALMARVIDAWSGDPRLQHVYRVRDVVAERSGAIPNIDLALGAFTWLASMPASAGEAIFAIARTAGWLAHAIEEYEERPLRFRPRARYLGPRGR